MIAIKAVLFDWGEILVHVPGMGHSPDRHIACLERLFVGDDLDNDVRGPKARGLGGVIALEPRFLIGGRFAAAAAGNTFTVMSPITGQAYAEVASAGPE